MIAAFILAIPAGLMTPPLRPPPTNPNAPCLVKPPGAPFDRFTCDNRSWA